ncbi:sulfotransferase family protein [Sphingomonas radiodurans]|uniref:sulfotransferase family protein n=1 Tax=Sphingomonas radiodurans TaxID=2890321 RepID=UPI001E54374A|nr:sulfotransferase [Sphingomonas radiodurans]WBH15910.1 sulfotransferase [Sphingomonas radiodurans]
MAADRALSSFVPRIAADTHGSPVSRHPRVNEALEQAWSRGWLSRPILENDALIAAARLQAGAGQLGADGAWRARLDVLTDALRREAHLTALGTVIAHGQLVAALANRARMQALWQQHPEILAQPIRRPIIVLGQMRSGSTRMQRLLACDPRLAHTRFFESWNPLPSGRLGPIDDRRLRGWLALRCAEWLNPEFQAIHPTTTSAPDEETGLHNISIFGAAFEAQWRVPSFVAFTEQMDTRPVYAEFKRMLQTLAWLRRERGDRPLVLKLPQFTQDLAAVLDIFPDARLVCLDRPAIATVASSASLVHSQMRVQSNAVDPHWVGAECLRKVALRQRRTAEARRAAEVPQVDVGFEAVGADWRTEMKRVYRMLGLPLTDEVAARMARYLARPQDRGIGMHRYSLADYGLTEASVARALAGEAPLPLVEAPLRAA